MRMLIKATDIEVGFLLNLQAFRKGFDLTGKSG